MDVLSLGWQAVIRLLPDAEIRHFAWVAKK
jgi:hypothetical protein